MKELIEIEEIIRSRRAIEKETRDEMLSKVPDIAKKLISDLFDLIDREGKTLRISLAPIIVLNYAESNVYLRIVPLEAGALMLLEYKRNSMFPVISMATLFGVSSYEMYDLEFRKELCECLSKEIKEYLNKELKCGCEIKHCTNGFGYNEDKVEYQIIPDL